MNFMRWFCCILLWFAFFFLITVSFRSKPGRGLTARWDFGAFRKFLENPEHQDGRHLVIMVWLPRHKTSSPRSADLKGDIFGRTI